MHYSDAIIIFLLLLYSHLFNFACTAVHLHHCTKWACAHLKPPLPVFLCCCALLQVKISLKMQVEMLHGISSTNTTISVLHCFCLLDLEAFSRIPWNHKFRSLLLAASLRVGVSLSMLLAILFAPEMPHLLARNVALQ